MHRELYRLGRICAEVVQSTFPSQNSLGTDPISIGRSFGRETEGSVAFVKCLEHNVKQEIHKKRDGQSQIWLET